MNLPNKITASRIILSLIIIILLVYPFSQTNVEFPMLFVNEKLVVNTKYILIGSLYIIAFITDIIDGKVARKNNSVTTYGALLDNLADKILLYPVLILLSSQGFIHPIVSITIILRDSVLDCFKNNISVNIKMSKLGKIQNYLLNIGIIMTLLYNLPFELWNYKVSDAILIVAVVLSVVSLFQFLSDNDQSIKEIKS